jgi:FtsP/CotA-like multicopper oxidase with cupredoxin domain
VIELTNNASEPHSIHTHVVEFSYANDGVDEPSLLAPGETHEIEWTLSYPGTFPYHDHGDEAAIGRGLFGALVVHAPEEEPAVEHLVVLSDFDQTAYVQLPGVADPETGEFPAEGVYRGGHQYMHTINGKAYEDAVAPFRARVGDLVRWRVVSIGAEFHTWHIHGHRWLGADGQLTDNIQLGPGMYTTFEYEEDKAGEWLVHCHVPDHMEGGMMTRYIVEP